VQYLPKTEPLRRPRGGRVETESVSHASYPKGQALMHRRVPGRRLPTVSTLHLSRTSLRHTDPERPPAPQDPDGASGTASPWRALRSGSLRLWLAANTLSSAGTWMQLVAQNLLTLHLSRSVALTGVSLSVQSLPGLLLGVSGGALVDRWPRRLTAAGGQVALAAIALTTAILDAVGLLNVLTLMALGLLSGLVATIDGPATALLGNDLVPREDVPSAIAVGSVGGNVGRLMGTAAASAVAAIGIPAAYAVNGLSFLAVAATIPMLRLADRPLEDRTSSPPDDGGSARAGLRYLLRNRSLMLLVVTGALTGLLGKNYSFSMAALVTGPLGETASAYGAVSVALAAGGIAGSLAAGRLRRPRLHAVVLWSGIAAGIQVLTGASPFLIGLIVLVVPMAAADSASATTTSTLLQTLPPEHLRGRVLGAWRTASTGWGLAGPPVLGLLLQLAGVRGGLAAGGLTVVLALGIGVLYQRRRATAQQPANGEELGLAA
jgi:MFS family permease